MEAVKKREIKNQIARTGVKRYIRKCYIESVNIILEEIKFSYYFNNNNIAAYGNTTHPFTKKTDNFI